jgi:hypothetical protein
MEPIERISKVVWLLSEAFRELAAAEKEYGVSWPGDLCTLAKREVLSVRDGLLARLKPPGLQPTVLRWNRNDAGQGPLGVR